jgi:hypothetical protein
MNQQEIKEFEYKRSGGEEISLFFQLLFMLIIGLAAGAVFILALIAIKGLHIC